MDKLRNSTIVTVFFLVVILSTLTGCAATAKKSSGVITSREATEIWHSYEILPNYKYYYIGPDAEPRYIIGIDDKYHLASKNWKPVDLTPEILNKWLNFIRPRVGYDPDPFGAFIVGPNGERIGLWYSLRRWWYTGYARLGENNQVFVTRPNRVWGG